MSLSYQQLPPYELPETPNHDDTSSISSTETKAPHFHNIKMSDHDESEATPMDVLQADGSRVNHPNVGIQAQNRQDTTGQWIKNTWLSIYCKTPFRLACAYIVYLIAYVVCMAAFLCVIVIAKWLSKESGWVWQEPTGMLAVTEVAAIAIPSALFAAYLAHYLAKGAMLLSMSVKTYQLLFELRIRMRNSQDNPPATAPATATSQVPDQAVH